YTVRNSSAASDVYKRQVQAGDADQQEISEWLSRAASESPDVMKLVQSDAGTMDYANDLDKETIGT
ncbi:MAG: hypothetical protein QUS33_04120, partial [Dehalococcoidia bacterium]|nr:hypothetical protein [Dehalococcoidia bacterium]